MSNQIKFIMKNLKLGLTLILSMCISMIFAQGELALNSDNSANQGKSDVEAESTSEVQMLEHETIMFVSPDNDVYFQKSLPIYLWVSTSPDLNAKKHLLVTEDGDVNHFHLDTEGRNTVRSPWAVDPVTGEYVKPMHDVIFDVYADGIAPVSKSEFTGAPKFYKDGKLYFGKGLQVKITSNDLVSGIANTYISLNGDAYKTYNNEININKEYDNRLLYYSIDHVGNFEEPISKDFFVDLTPPETKYSITGNVVENVLSADAKIELSSSDNLSGVKHIKYKIGKEGIEKIYTSPIALSSLQDGETEIQFYAVDNVDNAEEIRSTSDPSSGAQGDGSSPGGSMASISLYVDRIAPEVDIEILGDKFEDKYTFVSERSRIKLSATDNKAGVEKITYGINIPSRTHEYTEPFPLLSNSGVQYVNYGAMDIVTNWTPRITKAVYLDKTAPVSSIAFIGSKFWNRDTLFITKDTKIKLNSSEQESGIQNIKYQLDNKALDNYSDHFTCEKAGLHKINYYGIDNVNNREEENIKEFVVDNDAPIIKCTFSVESIGKQEKDGNKYLVFPSNTLVYLGATDNASGVSTIQYKLNGGTLQTKTQIGYFKPGTFELEIIAKDVLSNESSEVVRFIIEK